MARGVPKGKSIKCGTCGKRISIVKNGKKLPFKERMARLRRHYKRSHPKKFKKQIKKALKTKKKKGNPCR